MKALSIIIPIYNEENSIEEVIGRLDALELPDSIEEVGIVLVDDHSDDRTTSILKGYQDRADIQLVQHEKNRGKGAAIRTGIEAAKGDLVLIQDADLELSPDDIPMMIKGMEETGVEFINGSRYLPGRVRPLQSFSRYLANYIFTLITSVLVNVRLTDMACGYKLMHRSFLRELELKEDGFAFEAELMIKALKRKRNNVAEVPVRYFPRNEGEGKKFRTLDGVRILLKILRYGIFSPKTKDQ